MPFWIGILVVADVVAAIVFIRRCFVPGSPWLKLAAKVVASALFVLIGALCALSTSRDNFAYAAWMLLGLLLGLLGDLALELSGPFPAKGTVFFLTGLSLFLLGHIAYIVAMALWVPWVWWRLLAWAGVLAGGLALLRALRIDAGPMRGAVWLYVAAISVMLGSALQAAISRPGARSVTLLIAAALFFASDTILAYIQFGPKKGRNLAGWNLSTYYTAQILLALSIGMG